MNKNTSETLKSVGNIDTAPKLWRPTRDIVVTDPSSDEIARLSKRVDTLTTTVTGSPTQTVTASPVTPAQVTGVGASATPVGGHSVVAVNFTPGANFSRAEVWFTGYLGSSTPQLVAEGSVSPIQFTADTTEETVTVTVVAVSGTGQPALFSTAPTTTVTLSAVATPPPAPTIYQSITALAGGAGWQFQFNVINGLLATIISGYWVYRSLDPDAVLAVGDRFQFITQPPSNIGIQTFQDGSAGTTQYYYWVTAVDSVGLESTKTPAQAVVLTQPRYPTLYSGDFASPTQAFDGNETSGSSDTATSPSNSVGSVGDFEIWHGFSGLSGVVMQSLTLKVLSSGSISGNGRVTVSLSVDGGVTWTTLRDVNLHYDPLGHGASSASMAKEYVSVSLPLTTNISSIQVQAETSANTAIWFNPDDTRRQYPQYYVGSAFLKVYEIHLDISYITH